MTIVKRYRDLSSRNPEAPAFTFLIDGDEQASLTRGEFDARARALAAALVARGLSGQRVLLLHAPGLDFVVAFFGCLYAGAVAVPAYPPEPGRLARTLPRLQAIVADCSPALVLTTSDLLEAAPIVFSLAPDLEKLPWAASDVWASGDPRDFSPELPRETDLAFLQYTSGSTASPKGVMVGHDNLAANLEQLRLAADGDENSIVVSWVPSYHDMGLMSGIIWPAYLGARSILMSPLDFLRRPSCWLQAIDKYRASVSAAPNFALDLCARKVTENELAGLDLSCWKLALVGAEPIRRETLDRFAALLSDCAFHPNALYQGYGLAEAVVATTGGRLDALYRSNRFESAALQQGQAVVADDETGSSLELVSSGTPLVGEQVEIVDPATRLRCAPGRVGEIWVAGANVARGYFNRDAETASTFGARIAGTDEGPFLRTGDLGFIADGELFVAGRMKDVVIIRGKNHYPQDIEHTAQGAHPLVRPGGCAAFAVADRYGEALVVVAEVDTKALPEGDERAAVLASISESIRLAVNGLHAVQVQTVALVAPGQVPKTSSGKVMRRGCREDLLAERLTELGRSVVPGAADVDTVVAPPFPAERSEAALTSWLAAWIGGRYGVSPEEISPELPFAQVGLDSLHAVELAGEIEVALDRRLPATLFIDYPSISALARYLCGDPETIEAGGLQGRSSCVVPLATGGAERPIVLIPGLFGMLGAFSHLVSHLQSRFPIWGLDLPVHLGLPTPEEVADLASRYADDLIALPNAEPFRIAGYCTGGMVAIELGRQLELRGRAVEKVLLIDAPYLEGEHFDYRALEAQLSQPGRPFEATTLEEAVRTVARYIVGNDWSFGQGEDYIERMVIGGVANLRTFQGWAPRPISTPTTLLSADERISALLYEKDTEKNADRWNRFLGQPPELVIVPGNHHSMLQPPHVAHLADVLTRTLAGANLPR